ncbi:M17 family metallopeptidase [Mycoplasma struthionis]|uniref:Probable cytosol aminopeptidase n=1 Tax=Mycoplasma struthionis TaxID=538220 RepID=A0A3G8LFU5_9MOLU|nr:leucyl aminopeptidase family protein [Mycoplasma struthionis]AZG68496.1 leucyl aminopeptidase family protein [Mycoplasma struthionis]TPI02524.1 leucyl aminopeptidase family protein [Mycoplasma struthionis]
MELIKNLDTKRNDSFLLKGIFKDDNLPEKLVEKNLAITEYHSKKLAYVYLGERTKVDYDTIYDLAVNLGYEAARDYQIDLASFVLVEKLSISEVIDAFTKGINFAAAKLYNKKTYTKKENKSKLSLLLEKPSHEAEEAFKKASVIIDAQNWARTLGIMAPNDLNSEQLAEKTVEELKEFKNLKVTVLNKKQIEKLGMGLLLSVNRGSTFEPRVVIIEYTGNKYSKEKTVMVGKGITFDSGGYNIKTGRHMGGMKYDMGGAATVAAAMKAIAQLRPNTNVSAIMCITDNRVNGDASLPDSVWTALNGITVEVNNTDAEGRLVMADGLCYATKYLNATRLIDVATLTGAMVVALGDTYTGVWATTEKAWNDISLAAKKQHELIWRMPFDKDFLVYMKGSKVADLKNTDFTRNAGSCSAAMFLKEFTNNTEYLHLDIAGTCDVDEKPMFAMVRTLIELGLK